VCHHLLQGHARQRADGDFRADLLKLAQRMRQAVTVVRRITGNDEHCSRLRLQMQRKSRRAESVNLRCRVRGVGSKLAIGYAMRSHIREQDGYARPELFPVILHHPLHRAVCDDEIQCSICVLLL
jgi:hypothetical protein